MSYRTMCLIIAIFPLVAALNVLLGSTRDIKKRSDIDAEIKKKKLCFLRIAGIVALIVVAYMIFIAFFFGNESN